MAYAHGTASDCIDLWNKLITFLTTNATLVAAGEDWEVVWTASGGQPNGVVLKGPGASGSDSILVGLKRYDAPSTDQSYIDIRGMTGVLSNAADINSHIGGSPVARSFFDTNPMEYWFIASGRRFIVIAKMSTVYSMLYGGFFLPYATPLAYPYPLCIGGSSPDYLTGDTSYQVNNWRSQSELHRNFFYGEYNDVNGSVNGGQRASGYMIDPAGNWLNIGDADEDANVAMSPWAYREDNNLDVDDWKITASKTMTYDAFGYNEMRSRIEENIGGGYSIGPMTLIQTKPSVQTIGVLDGIFWVPGQNNAVENTLTISGVTYLVMQNVFRTAVNQYSAIRLD